MTKAPSNNSPGPDRRPEATSAQAASVKPSPLMRVRDFVEQHRSATLAGVGAVVIVGVAVVLYFSGDDAPPTRKVQEFTIVNVVPPPPPPPPPPPEQQPPPPEEQKMIEQPPLTEKEIKEEAKVEEPKDAPPDEPPPGPLGLDQTADGPGDNFNLVGKPGGRGILGGGGGGSRWGYYVAMVQQQIEAALRANPKTRNSVAQVQVQIWADHMGRVNRVQIVNSSGSADVDAVIRGEVLSGLTLRQPPPADMPMPMVTRITLRQPS